MSDVHQQILEELKRIEKEEDVRILYACESGSRAWGFPSKDSDYDVRFLYIRPVDWYLSIFEKRDVIERPISDHAGYQWLGFEESLEFVSQVQSALAGVAAVSYTVYGEFLDS